MRRFVWAVPPLLVIVLMAGFMLRPGREEQTTAQFVEDRAVLEELAQQVLENGSVQGIEVPGPWQGVELYDSGIHTVGFSMGASGLGSEMAYWGVNYVPSNSDMVGFQGRRWDYWKAHGDGRLYYEPEGDNTCYVKKLADCWYYYEMRF